MVTLQYEIDIFLLSLILRMALQHSSEGQSVPGHLSFPCTFIRSRRGASSSTGQHFYSTCCPRGITVRVLRFLRLILSFRHLGFYSVSPFVRCSVGGQRSVTVFPKYSHVRIIPRFFIFTSAVSVFANRFFSFVLPPGWRGGARLFYQFSLGMNSGINVRICGGFCELDSTVIN